MRGARRRTAIADYLSEKNLVVLLLVAVFLYGFLIAQQLLLAMFAVGLIVVTYGGIVVWRSVQLPGRSPNNRYVQFITAVCGLGVFLYGLFVAKQLLLGVFVAVIIVLLYATWRGTYACWTYLLRSNG